MALTKRFKITNVRKLSYYFDTLPTDVLVIILDFAYSNKGNLYMVQNYAFHRAIELNHKVFISFFFENRLKLDNSKDIYTLTPVQKLCINDDNLDILVEYVHYMSPILRDRKKLLKYKSTKLGGLSALHVAAYHGSVNICKFILKNCGHELARVRTYKNKTTHYQGNHYRNAIPLDFAIVGNQHEVVDLLLPFSQVDGNFESISYDKLTINGMPSIFYGVHMGDDSIFKTVLRKSDINCIYKSFDWRILTSENWVRNEYTSVLRSAICNHVVDELRILKLVKHIDSKLLKTGELYKCLCDAIRYKRYKTCDSLLDKYGARIIKRKFNWHSIYNNVFQVLCSTSDQDLEELLLHKYRREPDIKYAEISCSFSKKDVHERRLIFDRVINLDVENLLLSYNPLGYKPIHYAAYNGLYKMVELFLLKGEDVNVLTRRKQTPLHLAVIGGHFEVVKVLLEFKASTELRDDVFIANQRFTPLLYAMGCSDTRIATLLLDSGADPHVVTRNEYLNVPIQISRKAPSDKVAIKLFQIIKPYDVYLNGPDRDGRNSLHWAIAMDRPTLVHYLLKNGVNKNSVTVGGFTPLMMACAGVYCNRVITTRYDIVEELLNWDVDYKIKTPIGNTAIDFARATDEYNNEEEDNVYLLLKRYYNLYD